MILPPETPRGEAANRTPATELVLVVEDDPILAATVVGALSVEGFIAERAGNGLEALERLASNVYALLVVDVMMPALDGMALVRRLRTDGDRTPILMISAKQEVEDRVTCLNAGADDYLVKPFKLTELIARARALLRRSTHVHQTCVGPLTVDWEKRTLSWDGIPVKLTNREFSLFAMLVRNRGRTVTRQEIIADLFKDRAFTGSENLIEVNLARLRRKLEAAGCPALIHTTRGIGYRLADGIV